MTKRLANHWHQWLKVTYGQLFALMVVASLAALAANSLQSLFTLAADPISRQTIGQRLLAEQRPLEAALVFEQPSWQAVAHFRATRYRRAAQLFQSIESTEALYNYGVALARLRRWDDAIAAFRVVLDAHPDHGDARFNYELIRQVIERKTEQQARQEGADQGGQLYEVSEDVEQAATQSAARESGDSIEPDAAAGGNTPPSSPDGQSDEGNASPQRNPRQRQRASATSEREAANPAVANLGDRTSEHLSLIHI